ncbi:mitogen-activated protein kinase kinase kinase 20-like [Cornus florida]|uniref:mitogen-activated protein kinase kinase kinase 20-like n=1 Tax=Cornus florida TaxID=4283 RepID=UPI00289F7327|nr:mitogen-activated protein kinase kinase kinase 20-like [Cornus florida]
MDWVRGEIVGKGNFATVNLAIPRSQSSQTPPLMAVKSCGVLHSAFLLNEKSILEELNQCPDIIRCFGKNLSFEKGEKLYNLLLEYASAGDLAGKLRNSGNNGLPEYDVRRFTKSIVKALHYIHNHGYVHCDIKLQNCLLFCSNQRDGEDVLKIADFGMAKKAGMKSENFEVRGTPLYMSPEMVMGGEQEPPADIWALGCVVAEMATGKTAWIHQLDGGMWELWLRIGIGDEVPKIPTNLSSEGRDFLRKCFVKDPRNRWTAEMLLNHPFITDKDDESNRPSPTNPFDFRDWACLNSSETLDLSSESDHSEQLSPHELKLSLISPAKRLRWLKTNQAPDWSVSKGWRTVRKAEHIQPSITFYFTNGETKVFDGQ